MNKTIIDNNKNQAAEIYLDEEIKQLKTCSQINRDYGTSGNTTTITTTNINVCSGEVTTLTSSNKTQYNSGNNSSSNEDDDDEDTLTTASTSNNNSGFIVKNKYFFNDNEDFNLNNNNDNIEIINEKLYKEHFKTITTVAAAPNKTNLPIFTSANKSSVFTNVTVDSNTSNTFRNSPTTSTSTLSSLLTNKSDHTSAFSVCSSSSNNNLYGRYGPTNRHYEAIKQNKFNSIQNNKLYDEVYDVSDEVINNNNIESKMTSINVNDKKSSSTSDSVHTSRTSSCSSRSSLDDEGYCNNNRKNDKTPSTTTNDDHIIIKIEDSDIEDVSGLNSYNKNFKRNTSLTNASNSCSSSLMNQKYKFEKTIESTAAAQQQAYKSLDSYSFEYVDDDEATEDYSNSNKSIDRDEEISNNTRSNLSNLKSDFINHSTDSSAELLQDITSRFAKKFTSSSTSITTAVPSYVNSNTSKLQSNFYNLGKPTEVDKQVVYGLKSSTSSLPSTTMTSTSTTATKGYNKFNNTNSTATLFSNSSNLYKTKPQSNFDIDSHGSTGTNSSNHDDSSDRSEECFESSKTNVKFLKTLLLSINN